MLNLMSPWRSIWSFFICSVSGPIELSPNTSSVTPCRSVALRAAVLDQRRLGVAEHVDEAGRDGEPGRVDLLASALGAEIADRRDAIVEDRDVADLPRRAGAVVDRAVADHDVVLRRRRLRAAGRQRRDEREERQRELGHAAESTPGSQALGARKLARWRSNVPEGEVAGLSRDLDEQAV